ncbi:hypothetical protein D1872_296220 [compost metagenome]
MIYTNPFQIADVKAARPAVLQRQQRILCMRLKADAEAIPDTQQRQHRQPQIAFQPCLHIGYGQIPPILRTI